MSDVIGHNLIRNSKPQRKAYEVIHRADCRVMRDREAIPWLWAEGRPVAAWLTLGWFKPCKVCHPEESA